MNGQSIGSWISNRIWLMMRQVALIARIGRQVGEIPLQIGIFLGVIGGMRRQAGRGWCGSAAVPVLARCGAWPVAGDSGCARIGR